MKWFSCVPLNAFRIKHYLSTKIAKHFYRNKNHFKWKQFNGLTIWWFTRNLFAPHAKTVLVFKNSKYWWLHTFSIVINQCDSRQHPLVYYNCAGIHLRANLSFLKWTCRDNITNPSFYDEAHHCYIHNKNNTLPPKLWNALNIKPMTTQTQFKLLDKQVS